MVGGGEGWGTGLKGWGHSGGGKGGSGAGGSVGGLGLSTQTTVPWTNWAGGVQ